MNLDKSQIARQFNRAANSYDDVSGLQVEMARHLIDAIPDSASGDLIDMGCGTGWALEQLAATNRFELSGIDLASSMIQRASLRAPGANLYCCDLEETPIADDSIDVVFSNAAIQWCDNQSAIAEMYRIARPNGVAVVSTFGPKTLKEWQSAWQSTDGNTDRVHSFHSAKKITEIFEAARFVNISVTQFDREFSFSSVDEMFSSIKKLGATNASPKRNPGLSGKHQFQKIRSSFQQKLLQNGHLTLTFDCIFVTAFKSETVNAIGKINTRNST